MPSVTARQRFESQTRLNEKEYLKHLNNLVGELFGA